MCSLGDDYLEEQETSKFLPKVQQFQSLEKICNKCKENISSVVLRHKDAYCKQCFLLGTTHKFKAFLGKHRFIYPNDKVLIVHRAGQASTALLHFIRTGLDLTTPKKLRFEPIFLYVHDNDDLNNDESNKLLTSLKQQVESYKFELYFTSLPEYIQQPENIKNILHNFKNFDINIDKRTTIINKNSNETNRKDILKKFELKLILEAAKALGCKCIFTNELGIDIASQLLTNVSLGRGAHLALDVGICDNRDAEIKIIRPLRTFDVKELALYNYFNNLEPVIVNEKHQNVYNSVQNLMKSFVSNLQTNFPATITTIVRTGDKLSLDNSLKNNAPCLLCKAPSENDVDDLTSAESTNFSHWVSTQTVDYNLTPTERYNQTLESFNKSKNNNYCFACSRLSKDLIQK